MAGQNSANFINVHCVILEETAGKEIEAAFYNIHYMFVCVCVFVGGGGGLSYLLRRDIAKKKKKTKKKNPKKKKKQNPVVKIRK